MPDEVLHDLTGKTAIVIGAGQSPGEGMGNGRASALLYARHGARVLAVDMDMKRAADTVAQITESGGVAQASQADVTDEASLEYAISACKDLWGSVDILHNNVGVSLAGGDAPVTEITEQAFDNVVAINLRGTVMACKHALPVMREQQSGVIINISSIAACNNYPLVTYKATKSAMIAFTQQLAIQNAEYGIRANVILPGLLNTPMAVDTRARVWGRPRADVAAERDAKVPLRHKMGTAWDVANAALFLVSDEANFITGVSLPVDGGTSVRVG